MNAFPFTLLVAVAVFLLGDVADAQQPRGFRAGSQHEPVPIYEDPPEDLVNLPGEFFPDTRRRQRYAEQDEEEAELEVEEEERPRYSVVTRTVPLVSTVTQTLPLPKGRSGTMVSVHPKTVVISKCTTKVAYPGTVVVTRTVSVEPRTVYVQASNFGTVTVTVSATRAKGQGRNPSHGQGYLSEDLDLDFESEHERDRRAFGEDVRFRGQKLTGFFPDTTAVAGQHFYSMLSEFNQPEGSGEF